MTIEPRLGTAKGEEFYSPATDLGGGALHVGPVLLMLLNTDVRISELVAWATAKKHDPLSAIIVLTTPDTAPYANIVSLEDVQSPLKVDVQFIPLPGTSNEYKTRTSFLRNLFAEYLEAVTARVIVDLTTRPPLDASQLIGAAEHAGVKNFQVIDYPKPLLNVPPFDWLLESTDFAIRPLTDLEKDSILSASVADQTRVICPLHGIRTLAVWQKGLSDLASSRGWVCRLDRWSYGRFSLWAFLTPWTREAKLNWLRRQYDVEIHDRRLDIEQGQTPSVVAHSFGTYILGYTLLRFKFIRFNKVILCGSILPRDFPWDKLIERGQVQAVRNEYGVRDPWVRRVRWFVRGTGPSGASGFTCQHDRLEQEEFEYDHGDYFGPDHMEDRWIPFLNKPLAEIPRAKDEPRIPRPKTAPPWGLYVVVLVLAVLAGAVGAYVASRDRDDDRKPRERDDKVGVPQSSDQKRAVRLKPLPMRVLHR